MDFDEARGRCRGMVHDLADHEFVLEGDARTGVGDGQGVAADNGALRIEGLKDKNLSADGERNTHLPRRFTHPSDRVRLTVHQDGGHRDRRSAPDGQRSGIRDEVGG